MASVLIVIWFTIDELDQQKYFLTVVFAVILVALSDVGGDLWSRLPGMSLYAVVGAALS